MEGLDDIIDLSDGENTPALWGLSKKPIVKSSRYATLQPYNDDVLGDDDASDNLEALMNNDRENALKPGASALESDEEDALSLPGHTRYIKYDDDEFLPENLSKSEAEGLKSEEHLHDRIGNANDNDNGKTRTNTAAGNDVHVIEDGKFRFDDFRFDDDADFNFDDPTIEAPESHISDSDCVPSVSPRDDMCDDDVGHGARPEYFKTLRRIVDNNPTLAADTKKASFGGYATSEINAMWDVVTRKPSVSKFGFNKLLASAASEDWKGDEEGEKDQDEQRDAREWNDDAGLDACDLKDKRGAGAEDNGVPEKIYDFAVDGSVLKGVDGGKMRRPYDFAQVERRPAQNYDEANVNEDIDKHDDSSFASEEERNSALGTRKDAITRKMELASTVTQAVRSGPELQDGDYSRSNDHQTSCHADAEALCDDVVATVKNDSCENSEAEREHVEDHEYAAAVGGRRMSENEEEIPIKNEGQYHFDDLPIKSAGQYNFDDVPIKSTGQYNFDDNDKRMKSSEQESFSKDDVVNSDNSYNGEDQRIPSRQPTPQTVDDALTRSFTWDASNDANDDALCTAASGMDTIASELRPKLKKTNTFPVSSPPVTKSEAATTVGDADTVTSPCTPSTVVTAGAQEVVKRPFLRKGTRTASTLRAKGAKPTSFTAPRQTGATLTLTKAHDGGGKTGLSDPATPSASSALPLSQHTGPGNLYKNTYNARAASQKRKAPGKTKRRPQDAMWDDNSGDDSDEDDDKQSFMDFMRDKGLSVPELKRMAARTQQQPKSVNTTVKTPNFRGAFSSAIGGSTNKDTEEKVGTSSSNTGSTPGISAKKGFREYYYEKFGSPDGNFAGLREAVGNDERNEKRAFRDLYHSDGVGTATSSRDTRENRASGATPALSGYASQKIESTSYASLWEEEMAKKTDHRKWDDPWSPDDDPNQPPDGEVFDRDSAPVSNLVRKHFYKEPPKGKTIPEPPAEEVDDDMRVLLQQKLTLLDAQIARFKKENEQCKKLRLEREQALRDAEKEREKMQAELNCEREKMRAELEEDQEKLRRERKRVEQDRERHRQQLTQSRADQDEITMLRQQVLDMKEEHAQKEQRWRRTVERLQKQNDDLKKKNQEANDEIAWALKRNAAPQPASRRAASLSAVIKSPKGNPNSNPSLSTAEKTVRAVASTRSTYGPSTGPVAAPSKPESKVARQQKAPDNRVERALPDGGREIEFPNGLKKVLFPDGSCSVLFANGDTKECKKDGSVVYRYHGTKAKQTTLADGTELYEFSSGQSEAHYPDGSKDISFPNGTTKKIAADGTENISFGNGATKMIPA
eukprot:GEMP01001300.1.p1 GENE.GEMP01001300.1~~GEMP01001300.1.p1  ORF type:complete len:1321 (+),score=319.59 GEMP01001300.1:25-3963(+)